jgi:hypothetical protein
MMKRIVKIIIDFRVLGVKCIANKKILNYFCLPFRTKLKILWLRKMFLKRLSRTVKNMVMFSLQVKYMMV